MIGYVTLGTNDLPRAIKFYDELLAIMDAQRFMGEEGVFQAWAVSPSAPAISVTKPWDGNAATVGNGTMIALMVESKQLVDKIHAKALELGGKDEGPVGPRMDGFYAGYFRDLDGNKLNVFHMEMPD